jgi:3-hydroxyacyl-[acyl-carrier-protein] dehydratase
MIMLDLVEELTDTTALGWKNVTVNEPYFRGHFPNAPVMPGVLVMEALCQLVWAWVLHVDPNLGSKTQVRMTGIRKLRFRRPTMPGDRLRLEIEQLERSPQSCLVKATASVDGHPAVTSNLSFEILSQ